MAGDLQKIKAALYETDVQAFKSLIEAEKVRISSIVETYQGEVEAYKSINQAEGIRLDGVVKAFAAKVEQATKVAELYLKEAEISLRSFTDQMNLKGELVKAGAQVASQLAASAMSSVNASASLGQTDSKGESYAVGNSYNKSDSTAEHTSTDNTKGVMTYSTNYNYSGEI